MAVAVSDETPSPTTTPGAAAPPAPRSGSARVRIVRSELPIVTARRLASDAGARLATTLREASRLLRSRAKVFERARQTERARQAIALRDRLAPFDEDADARLIAHRMELEAATALDPDIGERLLDLHRRVGLVRFADRTEKRALEALASAEAALPFRFPTHLDLIALRHARDRLVLATAERELAIAELEAAVAAEAEWVDERDPAHAELALAEAQVRTIRDVARQRARAQLIGMAAFGALALVLMGGAMTEVVAPVVGVGLACATMPPLMELFRRRRAVLTESRRAAESLESGAALVLQRRVGDTQRARDHRLVAERRLAEVNRDHFAASSRWLQVAGPGIDPSDAAAVLEAGARVMQLRAEAAAASAVADAARRAFAQELAVLGAPPELDADDALQHLQHLADLRPSAEALLESVAEADQRAVQREQLRALVGGNDAATLERIARRRISPASTPLVVVDDGDVDASAGVVDSLRTIDGRMPVSIVSEQPEWWEARRLWWEASPEVESEGLSH
jgi:hypothetical protein